MKIRQQTYGMPRTVARMESGNGAAPEEWRPLGTFPTTALDPTACELFGTA